MMHSGLPNLCDHLDAVHRYARVVGRDAMHAEDLAQECLARALSRPRDWQDVRDARAYLLTILHNLHVDDVARRWRDGVMVPIEDADPGLACAPEQFGRLLLRDLARSLQALPEERQEVAQLLNLPIGTVMSRLSRSRDALRRLMDEESTAGERQPRRRILDARREESDRARATVAE
jgi:RNA polymerase sigma-70 factor, ECF subfamily